MQTVSLSSQTFVSLSQGGPVFVGPTPEVTITALQRLTGFAGVSAYTDSGIARIDLNLCYRLDGGEDLIAFNTGLDNAISWATTDLKIHPVAGTAVPGAAGTYDVGLCVANTSIPVAEVIGTTGFVMVTN